MSAAPSAMRQSLTELSMATRRSKPYSAASLSAVSGFMVWLIRATASPLGQGRTRTGAAAPPSVERFIVPAAVVNQVSPVAGAQTAPATGLRPATRPMLTVKAGSPRMKALVPSTGSTRKKRSPMASGVPNSLACSSATMAMSGKCSFSRATISFSPSWSAMVTGLMSALAVWATVPPCDQ